MLWPLFTYISPHSFVASTGLTKKRSKDEPTTPLGIFNGTQFVLRTGFSSFLSTLTLLWRYGFSMFRLSRHVSSVIKKFTSIYDLQASGKKFQTVPDMLRAMGGEEMHRLTQITASQHLRQEMQLQQKLVDELICCAMKVNYGQNNSIDAFTAMVSLAGMEDGSLWSVVGGNYQIPKAALDSSEATFHPAKVLSITRSNTSSEPVYSLEYIKASTVDAQEEDSDDDEEADLCRMTTIADDFDVVIVALPLNLSTIQFKSFPTQIYTPSAQTPYHRTVATFIKGSINPQFFGDEKLTRSFPFDLLTTDMQGCPVDFNSVSVQIPSEITVDEVKPFCKPLTADPVRVWKVFSKQPLSEDDKTKLFSSVEMDLVKDWMAYPHYIPPESFPPFVLDDGMFYINGIEKAASAMEMSAIGAMNVSLLAKDYILASKKSV